MLMTKTVTKIPTRVKKIEHKKRLAKAWKDSAGNVFTVEEDLGWAVLFEGSLEWLFIGREKPDLEVGDPVTIIIERQ
jgi:hypothetical protein